MEGSETQWCLGGTGKNSLMMSRKQRSRSQSLSFLSAISIIKLLLYILNYELTKYRSWIWSDFCINEKIFDGFKRWVTWWYNMGNLLIRKGGFSHDYGGEKKHQNMDYVKCEWLHLKQYHMICQWRGVSKMPGNEFNTVRLMSDVAIGVFSSKETTCSLIRSVYFFLSNTFTSVYPTAMWLQCNRPITGAEGSYRASDG